MKKTLLFVLIAFVASNLTANAQDVINLGVSDQIATVLKAYVGSATDVTVIVPAAYTNPEYAANLSVGLTAIPETIKNLTIKGDGSNPTLLLKGFDLPASSLTSFTVKDITLKGVEDGPATLSLGNYLLAPTAITVESVNFINCSIANYRGVVRMKTSVNFTNLNFDNCIIRNLGNYNILNTEGAPAPTLANFSFKNSTVYGVNGNLFAATVIVPTKFTVSDCTFDNVIYTSGKYFLDFGASNTTSEIIIKNVILGKTVSTGAKGIRGGATPSVTNSHTTSDWVTAANSVTDFIAYENTAATLFKIPTTYDGASATATVGDYSFLDKSFAGFDNSGDPRWYSTPVSALNSLKKSHTDISYNGSFIQLNESQNINIYSVTGELLKSAQNVNQLSVSNFNKGVYIVKAGTAVQKFIVK